MKRIELRTTAERCGEYCVGPTPGTEEPIGLTGILTYF